MEQPLKVRLHILSPVHIGCDDVYEPTSFVIDEKKGKLIVFDPMDFIKTLTTQDKKKFTDICSQGNITSIVNIYKFLSNRQIHGREVEIADELVSHYNRVRDLPANNEGRIKQELNQFAISRTAYNSHNDLPFIQGSSIKGAMRTGYLSQLAVEKNITDRRDRAKELESELLGGSFDRDPFRMVKVSDFHPAGEVRTKIIYAVNKKKRASNYEARGPFQVVEVVEERAIFEGLINIETPEKTAGINKAIEIDNLLNSINQFYQITFDQEQKILNEIGAGSIKREDALAQSTMIRLGRHSGAESVTIEGNRSIKIMQRKGYPPKFLDHATTLWLASETSKPKSNKNLIPFGWALLEIIPFDIKHIFPETVKTINHTATQTEDDIIKKENIPVIKTIQSQTILWENAILTWDPGRQTLKAEKNGKKSELKVTDRSIVPAGLHKKFFEKKDAVKANVTLEQTGNAFKIIRIEE